MSDVTSDRWLSVDEIAAYFGVKRLFRGTGVDFL